MTADFASIALPDGRRLAYARFGEPTGRPAVYAHGFPACRLEAGLVDGAARQVGVAILAPDRPGLGRSDFQPGRAVLDWPADVAALADALGLDRFAVIGGSGGGPYALACACRMPDRVARVALVAGLGPTTGPAADRMSAAARFGFLLARRAPPLFRLTYGALGRAVARWPALAYQLNEATAPDRAVLARSDVRATLDASMQEAFHQGTAGALHDLMLLARPWGFDPEAIAVPVDLWHGIEDGVVPHAMAERLAARLPAGRLRLIPGEAHVSLPVRHAAEILRTLIS